MADEGIIIREAEVVDAEAIQRIYNPYIEETSITFEVAPITCEEMAHRIQDIQSRYPFLVAEQEGKVIGYAYASPYNEREAYRYTCDLSLYLDKNYRSQGIGSQLLEEIITRLKEQKIRNLVSLIVSHNEASVQFHEKHHFVSFGELKNAGYKFDEWQDIRYFVLDLWAN